MINASFSLSYANRCPRAPGPDDTSDPDFPDRDSDRGRGGPDDTSDPDFPSRDNGGYNGPDGPIDYPEYM